MDFNYCYIWQNQHRSHGPILFLKYVYGIPVNMVDASDLICYTYMPHILYISERCTKNWHIWDVACMAYTVKAVFGEEWLGQPPHEQPQTLSKKNLLHNKRISVGWPLLFPTILLSPEGWYPRKVLLNVLNVMGKFVLAQHFVLYYKWFWKKENERDCQLITAYLNNFHLWPM